MILETFHIKEGFLSLDDMRTQVDLHFEIVGPSADGNGLDFPRDGAAPAEIRPAKRSYPKRVRGVLLGTGLDQVRAARGTEEHIDTFVHLRWRTTIR